MHILDCTAAPGPTRMLYTSWFFKDPPVALTQLTDSLDPGFMLADLSTMPTIPEAEIIKQLRRPTQLAISAGAIN